MAVTIPDKFTRETISYFGRVSEKEIFNVLARLIRKQAKKIAEEIVEQMRIDVFFEDNINGKGVMLTKITKK